MDQAKAFFNELICETLTLPFFSREDLQGEYCLKDGKPKTLAKLNVKLLPQISSLKLREWKASDDVLLFRGLKHLEQLELIGAQLTSKQENELQHVLPKCKILFRLRYESLTVSEREYKKVFGLDQEDRPLEYIQNDYEDRGEVVFDRATGLMWQKSGSETALIYKDAEAYIKKLNRQKFAGFTGWRLPTIPELMSLLEPEKQSNDLYINPLFDKNQLWCWSSDKRSSESAWGVYFYGGYVDWGDLNYYSHGRGVRS